MTDEGDMDKIKQGVEIVGQIMRAAGNNENVKAAGNELGKTAVTLTKAINNTLLPLAAVNFAFEKAHEYFSGQFEKDITEKTQNTPKKFLITPKLSIAGPALQGLTFALEDKDLKEMYLNLLASSMDSRVSENAHPAFVEIIRQLSTDEAELLKDIFSTGLPYLPITQLRDVESSVAYTTVQTYVLNITDDTTGKPICCPEVVSMVDNLIRLGLLKAEFNVLVDIPNAYDWIDNRPEIELVKQKNKHKEMNIQSTKGMLSITSLGWNFAKAVGIHT